MTNIIRLAAAAFAFSTLGPVYSSDLLETKRDQNGRWIVLKTGTYNAGREFADDYINASLLGYYMGEFPEKFDAVKTTARRGDQYLSVRGALRGLSAERNGIFQDNTEWENNKSMSTVMRNAYRVLFYDVDNEHRIYNIRFIDGKYGARLFSSDLCVKIDDLNRFIAECGELLAISHKALVADHEALKSENNSLRTEYKELTIEKDKFKEEHEALVANHEALKSENNSLRTEYKELTIEKNEFKKEIERLNAEINRMRDENERLQQSLESSCVSGSCVSPEPCESENCPEWKDSTNC